MATKDSEAAQKQLEAGGEDDCTSGPVKKRGCTDILCLVVFIAHWFLFLAVGGLGVSEGNPARLYAHRDFKGAFCGHNGNFEPSYFHLSKDRRYDMEGFPNKAPMMNVHTILGELGKKIICSSTKPLALLDPLGEFATDHNLACGAAAFTGNLQAEMDEYTNPSKAVQKLTGGDGMLENMATYFHMSCVKDCDIALATDATDVRKYQYHPPPNEALFKVAVHAWNKVNAGDTAWTGAGAALKAGLEFNALPITKCPEDPMYCVPYVGLKFTNVADAGFCIPSFGAEASAAAGEAAAAAGDMVANNQAIASVGSDVGTMMGDVTKAWWTFIVMFFVSVAIGFGFMILLRLFVGVIVWAAVSLAFILFMVGFYYFYVYMGDMAGDCKDPAKECPEPDEEQRQNYIYVGYGFGGLAGLYALIVLCMCSRIRLGIAVNKVAAQYIFQTKPILLVPVVQMAILGVWSLVWMVITLYVISAIHNEGDLAPPGDTYTKQDAFGVEGGFLSNGTPGKCTATWPAGDLYLDEHQSYTHASPEDGTGSRTITATSKCLHESGRPLDEHTCWRCYPPRADLGSPQFWFCLFVLLWNNAFMIAVGQCTIAGSVGIWYFTPNAVKGSKPSVLPAVRNCFRYHAGSLAFGSFILAVVQLIKYALLYLKKQMEAQKNAVMAKVAGALACLVQCFERFVKFLNKNAYIQIALLGKNFCRSAMAAFYLILRNAGRLGVLATIGSMVTLIGLFFITAATTVIGYFFLINAFEKEELSSPFICTALYFMIGYLVGKLFMAVFGLAVDTTLQCFCADEELTSKRKTALKDDQVYTPDVLKNFIKDPTVPKKGCCG